MYEKDGEKYFVVDTHMHYWNAAPDNWVEGAEQYAKGWIECFYGYHGLGPEDTRWPLQLQRSQQVARGLYSHLPSGTPLWQAPGVFAVLDRHRLAAVLDALEAA